MGVKRKGGKLDAGRRDKEGNQGEDDYDCRQKCYPNRTGRLYLPQGLAKNTERAKRYDSCKNEASKYVARIVEPQIDTRIADKERQQTHADVSPSRTQPMAYHKGEQPHVGTMG